jgi:AhpC/TSA family
VAVIIRAPALALTLAFAPLAAAARAPEQPATVDLSNVVLKGKADQAVDVRGFIRGHRLTVIIFYSSSCPCFTVHQQRLALLSREFQAQGVGFLVVDSERHSSEESPPADLPELNLPLWRDEGGRLARRLDAQFATQSFILDDTTSLRYRGGIDSDRTHLTPDASPYLRQALLVLLAGSAPSLTTTKALGCVLRLR